MRVSGLVFKDMPGLMSKDKSDSDLLTVPKHGIRTSTGAGRVLSCWLLVLELVQLSSQEQGAGKLWC